ncbi:MAG TPA: hypothetical protein PLS53_04460 [Thermoanaerobaculaceae bacterium]|nr:hypothetical protein [Thermoanaerobaculaceae bacterium]HPS77390.1 hypothetical protein [Thermoanaerobaculaceae bacterium]
MKKLLILVVAVVVVVVAIKNFGTWFSVGRPTDDATRRVEGMIAAMEAQPKDEQLALCLWALNRTSLDFDTMRAFEGRWTEFWRESGLGEARGWKIASVEALGAGETRVVVKTDSQEVRLLVPERDAIRMAP